MQEASLPCSSIVPSVLQQCLTGPDGQFLGRPVGPVRDPSELWTPISHHRASFTGQGCEYLSPELWKGEG